MNFLQLKCPPPIVMMLSAILAGFVSQAEWVFLQQQVLVLENVFWPLSFVIAGISLALAGVKEFNQQQTTVNPLDPSQSSSLVTSGIYQFTRNPMYLGMLLVLLGWADLLDTILAYSGAMIFFVYISLFQIKPEEEILTQKFGEDFLQYCKNVRRWL
ncbi:MAG: protein-S-isoprenylcysteine O-methyltransferase Ste14 [Oleispira sp.]|jgi:protein-S-isoprenylcysteine O-methyltransferase Ste14